MRLLSALLVLVAISITSPLYAQEQSEAPYKPVNGLKLTVGQPVPDFPGPANLASFRGKPLIINFYSAYCPPCIREIPKLNALKQLNPDLQVLAVTPDPPEDAAAYTKDRFLAWSIAAPGQDYVFETLGIKVFPVFAIIDESGNLVSATYANELGGEDGHATLAGISSWIESSLSIKIK
ncbi:TlpA family protein disulfide reductase [Novilysobacter antarcticus]|uniref:TlpA family protein disulfide reductase n=1 Tax=Novilysobacter antarcticus TaxID=2862543 RepID=UPI001C9965B9|nr:TlpA disulfide reductase family protein [Lysobacter antarcticus]